MEPGARPCGRCLVPVVALTPPTSPVTQNCCESYFTDEGAEAQRGEIGYSQSHSK